jgi:hypothetical protein
VAKFTYTPGLWVVRAEFPLLFAVVTRCQVLARDRSSGNSVRRTGVFINPVVISNLVKFEVFIPVLLVTQVFLDTTGLRRSAIFLRYKPTARI